MKLKAIFTTIGGFMKKNLPQILTGAAIATGTGAVIVTVPATVKSVRACDQAKLEKGSDLTKGEVIKTVWKYYIPTVALGVTSITCVVMSNVESSKRIAALATAYAMSEEKLEGVRKKLLDKIGADKASDILSSATQEDANKANPEIEGEDWKTLPASAILEREDIPENFPSIKPLWFDAQSGRYFRATQADIDNAVNRTNASLNCYDTLSINDFYDDLGLTHTDAGYKFGWIGGHDIIRITKPDEYVTHPVTGEHAKVLNYNCTYLF